MPVAVACSCGAKLRVPDAAAGKRVKCPKCGNPVTVPEAEADYEEVDDEPTPPVAKKKPMLVDDDEPTPVQRSAAAKKQAEPVEVNEAVDDDEDDDTPKKKRRRDDDDEDDDTPKKKGKKGKGKRGKKEEAKSKLPLILGIGGGVFVLLTIAGIIIGVAMSGNGGQANGTTPAPPTAPKPSAPQLPQGWTKFQGEGFTVGLPPGVTFEQRPEVPPAGADAGPVVQTAKQWSNKAQMAATGSGYQLAKLQLKPEFAAKFKQDPDAAWAEVFKIGGQAANQQLTVSPVTLASGLEGRQINPPAGAPSVVTIRGVVRDDSLYLLSYLGENAGSSATAMQFFDTFWIE